MRMADLRAYGMRTKLALLCAMAGAMLVGIGLWKQQEARSEQWQPLNGQLNAAIAAAEQGHTAVTAGKESRMERRYITEGAAASESPASAEAGPGGLDAPKPAAEPGANEEAAAKTPSVPLPPKVEANGRLDLNRATAEQLDTLPGIGPAKASAIVADREAAGPFRSVDDLVRVKGIGPAIVEKLRDSVVALP